MKKIFFDDRGQMQTIEGLGAAFILITVLAIVIQTTSVTPLTSSFTNQHVLLELQNIGEDILTTLDQTPTDNTADPAVNSRLKQSVIIWMRSDNYFMFVWNNTTYVNYKNHSMPTMMPSPLNEAVNYTFNNKGVAYNIEVRYPDTGGNVRSTKMIWNGDPSDNSVTVTRIITLHDGYTEIPPEIPYDENYIIPDISPSTDLHNVVEVRLTMWVM